MNPKSPPTFTSLLTHAKRLPMPAPCAELGRAETAAPPNTSIVTKAWRGVGVRTDADQFPDARVNKGRMQSSLPIGAERPELQRARPAIAASRSEPLTDTPPERCRYADGVARPFTRACRDVVEGPHGMIIRLPVIGTTSTRVDAGAPRDQARPPHPTRARWKRAAARRRAPTSDERIEEEVAGGGGPIATTLNRAVHRQQDKNRWPSNTVDISSNSPRLLPSADLRTRPPME